MIKIKDDYKTEYSLLGFIINDPTVSVLVKQKDTSVTAMLELEIYDIKIVDFFVKINLMTFEDSQWYTGVARFQNEFEARFWREQYLLCFPKSEYATYVSNPVCTSDVKHPWVCRLHRNERIRV